MMRGWRFFALMGSFLLLLVMALLLSYPFATVAQDQDVGTPPRVLAPGVPVDVQFGLVEPTLPFTQCYAAFPLEPNDVIYIEPGVNIRAAGDGSSAIVWNTSYNQVDEEGDPLPEDEQFNVEAIIVS